MPDWKKIKAEYIRGGVSYRKLADKYGVPFSTICHLGQKEKWTDLRKKCCIEQDKKVSKTIADREAERAKELYDTADMVLRKIALQMHTEEAIEAGELSAYMNAIERYKKIVGIRDKADADEQQARIDKLRKESQIEEKQSEIKVTIQGDLSDYSV